MDWNFRIVKYLDELVQQLLNNMVEETAGVEKQNSWKGFKMSEHACSMEGVFWVSDSTASPYLKVAGPTRKIQSLSKLWQFRKWRAEIQNILLGLTGMGTLENSILSVDFLRSSNDLS